MLSSSSFFHQQQKRCKQLKSRYYCTMCFNFIITFCKKYFTVFQCNASIIHSLYICWDLSQWHASCMWRTHACTVLLLSVSITSCQGVHNQNLLHRPWNVIISEKSGCCCALVVYVHVIIMQCYMYTCDYIYARLQTISLDSPFGYNIISQLCATYQSIYQLSLYTTGAYIRAGLG